MMARPKTLSLVMHIHKHPGSHGQIDQKLQRQLAVEPFGVKDIMALLF